MNIVTLHSSTRFILVLACVAAALGADGAWRPFSADSPWNQRIAPDAASDPASAALIADFASRGPLHINIKDWSIAVYFVDADHTPRHDVTDSRPGVYGKGFEFPRRIPIPDGAVASPPVDGDNHLCIVDRARHLEWGMWWARQDAAGKWSTGLGAVTDLAGTGVSPPWFAVGRELDAARARASGFPLIAGLILVDEVKAGRIDHALVFAYDHCRTGFFLPPASTAQVTVPKTKNSFGIPMGGRIQLDPHWDVKHSELSAGGKIIARALQEYGAYCGDYADGNVLFAENSPAALQAWQGLLRPDELEAIFTPAMIREHFRVLEMGNVLPGQNCEIRPPYVMSFQFADPAATARIDYFTRTVSVAVPRGSDPRRLVPRFTVFRPGTSVLVNGAGQVSGHTIQDFSSPVTYRLVAPDGTANTWTVVVRSAK
ncbi:MAG TPA: hypothetical protein VLW52_17920 [Opitutaceae bacterium]|nr:hypothetical protein [Opitutaceae bacterium]